VWSLAAARETNLPEIALQRSLKAQRKSAEASRQAHENLARTRILSPVDGYVTNLLAQLGDCVNVAVNTISVIAAKFFLGRRYFEETNLAPIGVGDPAQIKLMAYSQIVRGHVDSIARAINVANAQPNIEGSPTSTRSLPGCAWLSASRCASMSMRRRRASSFRLA
jgi:multidrug resistance efflux pump